MAEPKTRPTDSAETNSIQDRSSIAPLMLTEPQTAVKVS